jgi:hypothetical protein
MEGDEEAAMDMSRMRIAELKLTHRHSDGQWSALREHHDSSQHDAERLWDKGRRIFRCDCGEEVAVSTEPDDAPPRA